ncbi:hypothetical protein [Micromonospora echinaurantiaca]|uniref:hypothetical protein n=1 Tax=Micromonospora echinaurantiaca TaxID=47857 RepID=UPI00341E9B93
MDGAFLGPIDVAMKKAKSTVLFRVSERGALGVVEAAGTSAERGFTTEVLVTSGGL